MQFSDVVDGDHNVFTPGIIDYIEEDSSTVANTNEEWMTTTATNLASYPKFTSEELHHSKAATMLNEYKTFDASCR